MWLALKGILWFETSCPNLTPKKVIMKLFTPPLALTLLAIAVAPCANAQEKSADSSAIKAKLKEIEDAWEKALLNKDHTAVGNMVADDFAGFNSKGKPRTKSQLVDEIKNETNTLSSSVNDDMDVHVYAPNLATVCGTSTEKGKDKDGKEFTHRYAWVDTWMERNGKWECIAEAVMQFPEKK
jgi:ketosteroid isomerase-like protein